MRMGWGMETIYFTESLFSRERLRGLLRPCDVKRYYCALSVQFCPRLRHDAGTELLLPTGIAQHIRLTAVYLPPVKVGAFLFCRTRGRVLDLLS